MSEARSFDTDSERLHQDDGGPVAQEEATPTLTAEPDADLLQAGQVQGLDNDNASQTVDEMEGQGGNPQAQQVQGLEPSQQQQQPAQAEPDDTDGPDDEPDADGPDQDGPQQAQQTQQAQQQDPGAQGPDAQAQPGVQQNPQMQQMQQLQGAGGALGGLKGKMPSGQDGGAAGGDAGGGGGDELDVNDGADNDSKAQKIGPQDAGQAQAGPAGGNAIPVAPGPQQSAPKTLPPGAQTQAQPGADNPNPGPAPTDAKPQHSTDAGPQQAPDEVSQGGPDAEPAGPQQGPQQDGPTDEDAPDGGPEPDEGGDIKSEPAGPDAADGGPAGPDAAGPDADKEGADKEGADAKGKGGPDDKKEGKEKGKGKGKGGPDGEGKGKGKGGPGGGGKGKGKGKGGGGGGPDAGGPVSAGGGGGGPGGPAPAPAGGGGAGPVAAGGTSETLTGFMDSHPDKAAEERVATLSGVNSRIGRGADKLGADTPKPPAPAWYDAILPRQEFAGMVKAMKTNPFKDEKDTVGKILKVLHYIGPAVDFGKSAASKIGLACTIGGAILSFLVPPVGAFLLTAGRVANAVSLVLSAVRLVISILGSVLTAVKIGTEKDPARRMELVGLMRKDISAGVGAGLDLILSKLGGKAKGAAKTTGSRVGGAMKGAWKNAKGVGKVTAAIKAGGKALGRSAKQGFGNLKHGFKNGLSNVKALPGKALAGVKSGINFVKHNGVGGTARIMGGKALTAIKTKAGEKFIKPIKDAAGGFKEWRSSSNKFWKMAGKDGYWKAVAKTNFPNAAKPNLSAWQRAKAGFGDVTDVRKGGYAHNLHVGQHGKESLYGNAESKGKFKEYRENKQAVAGGHNDKNRDKLIKSVHGDTAKPEDFANVPTIQLYHQAQVKLKDQNAGFSMVNTDWKSNALALGKSAITPGDSMGKTMLANQGQFGGWASGFMANSKTADEVKADKNKGKDIKGIAGGNLDKLGAAEMNQVIGGMQSAATGGTKDKVTSIFASTNPVLEQRENELNEMLQSQQGQDQADPQASAEPASGAGGGAASKAQPKEKPAPKAPPEDSQIPGGGLLTKISSEKERMPGIRTQIEKDIKTNEKSQKAAQAALKTAQGAKKKVADKGAQVDEQKATLAKETTEIAKAQAEGKKGSAKLQEEKGKTEGAKGQADQVKNSKPEVKADEAGKKKKEQEKAKTDKEAWDLKYKKASRWGKLKMKVGKAWSSMTGFLKRAAAWVWKKLIAPAIAAVKKAIAKVMNYITELITKAVLKIVGKLMGGDAEMRINATMLDMKKAQAAQAKAETVKATEDEKKTETKASKAEQKATAEIARTTGNITTGKGLIDELATNEAALNSEEAGIKAKRAAFKAQYTPYFTHQEKKKNEKGGAKAGIGGAMKTAIDAAAAIPGADPNAGPAQQEGDKSKSAVDKPLPPQVIGAMANAADVIAADGKASAVFFKVDAGKAPDAIMAVSGVSGDKAAALKVALTTTATAMSTSHTAQEAARQGRVAGLKAQAQSLASTPGKDAISKAKEIQKSLAEEASGVEAARQKAGETLKKNLSSIVAAAKGAEGDKKDDGGGPTQAPATPPPAA